MTNVYENRLEELTAQERKLQHQQAELKKEKAQVRKRMREEQERLRILEIEQQKISLRSSYASVLTQRQTDVIFEKAYSDGHSDGWNSVEGHYRDLVDFIERFTEAGE